ncbi:hypothetical protein ETAA8_05260 [Anatilimnocola aggregata]|uniref:Carboxypeptidase regulatory-like domain-containing protein n=1 Tax=Anatilimnocola aggregata TaxID=2528021 RepID=A0A517Y5D9_9BACT|nr:carboxypeptidase-like regulatory domain-containing protein [Anatilimnocola aggregata]QDU25458.1 hypothetical protein ETAA8_05260 [Anatilimnocola aggregata]
MCESWISQSRIAASVIGLTLLTLSGCADPGAGSNLPPLTKVTGTVRFQGQSVEGADVTFNNVSAGYSANAKTDSAGRFVLTTSGKEGAVPGQQLVSIRRVDVIDNTPPGVDPTAGGIAPPPTINWIVPQKYSELATSGLTAEVTDSGPNDFQFDLK